MKNFSVNPEEVQINGKAQKWDEGTLSDLADITPTQVGFARDFIGVYLSSRLKALIEAEVLDPKAEYVFDEALGQYVVTATGKPISQVIFRAEMDLLVEKIATRFAEYTALLLTGKLLIEEWQNFLAQIMKYLHMALAALAKGGWNQMNQSDYNRTSLILIDQYRFLAKYAAQVENGKQKPDGTLTARSKLYARAGRGTFYFFSRFIAGLRGNKEEKRVLGIADHCKTCLEQAALGWQPLGTLKVIGDSECLTNCHCHFEFR